MEFSAEQLLNSKEVIDILRRYKKTTTLLRPHASASIVNESDSKMGGMPNLTNFDSLPKCNACDSVLSFVIQIYKKDFSDFYFPEGKDLFQLFRCPNLSCSENFSDQSDQKMFVFYFNSNDLGKVSKSGAALVGKEYKNEISECELKPRVVDDHPNYDDYKNDELTKIEDTYGEDAFEYLVENYSAKKGTKYGGYPAWTQSPNYPICVCGKEKTFFFQLSSEDVEDGVDYPPPSYKWSAHGIMIGDLGNIYFFVCKDCGEDSVEMNWDCG